MNVIKRDKNYYYINISEKAFNIIAKILSGFPEKKLKSIEKRILHSNVSDITDLIVEYPKIRDDLRSDTIICPMKRGCFALKTYREIRKT
jgi:hypothetical protein